MEKLRCKKVALSCRFPADFKLPRLGSHVRTAEGTQSGTSRKKTGKSEQIGTTLTLQSFLFFFDFLAFVVFRFPLLFCAFSLSFPTKIRGSTKRKSPCIFRCFPCFFSKKARVGGSGNRGLRGQYRTRARLWGTNMNWRNHHNGVQRKLGRYSSQREGKP